MSTSADDGLVRLLLPPAGVALVTVAGTVVAAGGQPEARPLDPLSVALLLVGPLVLIARSRWPLAIIPVVALAAGTYLTLGYPFGPVFLATVVAMGGAVLRGRGVGAVAVTAGVFLALLGVHLARFGVDLAPTTWLAAAAWVPSLAAVLAGCAWWRARRERRAQERAALRETERRQVSEERLRIARDLHDSLGHHLSLINVQAGVAHTLFDTDPEQARRALATITSASRDVLVEMRSTLGVLRGVDEAPARHPVPGLDGLPRLAEANRAAGLAVELEVDDDLRLGPSTDHAVYRIVQEALTNVRRHAGARTAHVRVHADDRLLDVEITDDGTATPAGAASVTTAVGDDPDGGDGIPGMHERAAALGGRLETGPRATGGFRVHAALPLPAAQVGCRLVEEAR